MERIFGIFLRLFTWFDIHRIVHFDSLPNIENFCHICHQVVRDSFPYDTHMEIGKDKEKCIDFLDIHPSLIQHCNLSDVDK